MASITLTDRTFYAGGTSGASYVVGWESSRSRVCRYKLVVPATGASSVSLSFTGNSLAGVAPYPDLYFYIGTSSTSHANAQPTSARTGALTRSGSDYSGSASIILLPNTTYYVWVFPATTNYEWLYWSATTGHAVATTSGGTKSSMTIDSPQTLGTAFNIAVTRHDSSFTHTATYKCGSATGTICTKSATIPISCTLPITLANQAPDSSGVSVEITLTTYSGNTDIGSVSQTIMCIIPSSIMPSFSVSFSDPTGYKNTYGNFIQRRSTIQYNISASGAYGSTIESYRVELNEESFTESTGTTGTINGSGNISCRVSVTDSRNRTVTETVYVSVTSYTAPQAIKLEGRRCNASGTADDQGSYIQTTFSWSVTSLSSKNGKTIQLRYKKSTATSYTTGASYTDYAGTNRTFLFAADTGSSYDIQLYVADSFDSVTKNTSVSTGFTILHFPASGKGLGIGKVAEGDYLDVGMAAKFRGAVEVGTPTVTTHAVPKSYVDSGFAPSGFGLGATTAPVCINADTLLTGGFYIVSASRGTTNPANTEGSLIVVPDTYRTQLLFDTTNGMRRRIYLGSGWSAWEWEHPPMVVGTEYQTTERWSNKPVYTKIIDCGTASNGKAVAHGLSGCTFIRYSGILNKAALPYITYSSFTGSDTAYLRVTASNIYIYIGSNASGTVYAQLWYTKT